MAQSKEESGGDAAEARVVFATAADQEVAKRIALGLLERRLVACVNVVTGVTSHYRWQGRVEEAREVLLIAKTTADRVAALERAFHELHPYDTPEFVVIVPEHVSPRYQAWLETETR